MHMPNIILYAPVFCVFLFFFLNNYHQRDPGNYNSKCIINFGGYIDVSDEGIT